MNKLFRDLFGSKQATLDAIERIQRRLERVESLPVPDLPPETVSRITALSRRDGELQSDVDDWGRELTELMEKVDEFDHFRKEIVIAVSEGIERTDRAERRIKATVARARGQLAKLGYDDPGLEAEATELRLIDGDGSEKSGVPPLPAPVAPVESGPSSVRGVPAETLKRARGY